MSRDLYPVYPTLSLDHIARPDPTQQNCFVASGRIGSGDVINKKTQLNKTGPSRKSSEHLAHFDSSVESRRKSDHIARRSATATKTVAVSRDLLLFGYSTVYNKISK